MIERGCEDLPDLENGNISFMFDQTARFAVGTMVIYECNHGYKLMDGNATRTCVMDGPITDIWTGTAPICARECECLVSPVLRVYVVNEGPACIEASIKLCLNSTCYYYAGLFHRFYTLWYCMCANFSYSNYLSSRRCA